MTRHTVPYFSALSFLITLCALAFGQDHTENNIPYYYPQNCDQDQNAYIQGRIMCDDIKVKSWVFTQHVTPPDYVFKAGYPLLPLKTVEDSIAANGHLPGVPSAKTIRDSGIAAAEFSMTLLRKIEELTQYTIERQKLIEEQDRKISEWNREIEEMDRKVGELGKK